ncbi:MAG: tetratricopeptide repeat protein [Acidobacteriota bacterium]|nr:tetratricopeptide repeat protein [Acidobacteriota bacterium]
MLEDVRRFPVFALAALWGICISHSVTRAQDNGAELRKHFDAARQAQTTGDLDTAIREYQAVIRLQPGIAEVYANLGLVYQMSARVEESAQALQKALALKPELRGVNLFLGIDYVKLYQPERAIPYLKKAVQQEQGNKEAASWLGTALWDAGQTTAALAQLHKTAQAFPRDCDVLFLLGEAYQKAANQELEQVLALAIGKPLYHQAYGDIYTDQRAWDKAEGHYRRALQEDPKWPGAHLGMGEVYLKQDKLDESEAQFKQEKELDSSSAAASAKLGQIAILQGHPDEALRRLSVAIQLSPEKAADALDLPPLPFSSVLDQDGSRARAKYLEFISAESGLEDCPARHLALAFVNAQLGSTEKSASQWKLFGGTIHDSLPADHSGRAALFFARHDFDNAAHEFQSVIAADPRDLKSRFLLGRTYQHLSVLVLIQMLAIDPNFYRAHELLAKRYESRDENDKALAEYKLVEQARPTLSGLHFAMGHLLWVMQDSDSALVQLKEELRLNPDHPEANAEVGTILVNKHESDEAIPYLRKALLLKPDMVTARQQLGMAFYQRNELPIAERELKKAISDDPEGSAHFLLGMVYRKMGRAQESNAAFGESRRIRAERLAEVKVEKDESTP